MKLLLIKTFRFENMQTKITAKETETLIQCIYSPLVQISREWYTSNATNKHSNDQFDIAMGAFHGA